MQPAKGLPDWPRICGFGYSTRICTWKWCSSPNPVSACMHRSCRSFPFSRLQKSFPFLRYQSNALYRWDFEQFLPLGVRFWMLRWCTDFLGHCERLLRKSSSRIAISVDNVFCDVSCARNCRCARRIFKAYRTVTCIVTVSFWKGLFFDNFLCFGATQDIYYLIRRQYERPAKLLSNSIISHINLFLKKQKRKKSIKMYSFSYLYSFFQKFQGREIPP